MTYYFIDLFCGAGGVTTGIHRARGNGKEIAKVIACVNHDATAIASHAANHPDVLHYTEDIRTLDLTELKALVARTRAADPEAVICLWASLECTNFSKAKGGMPRDADSRTLAEHIFRYVEELDPDMQFFENVEEFMAWGPLDANGKPISRSNGRDYTRWVKAMCKHGYRFDYRILNAADFGAYTSRKRFFGQFAKPQFNIAWPEATHAKKALKQQGLFPGTKPWKPVRDVLNLEETGESIFVPGRIRSDKTYERIYHGLIKFVAGGKSEFDQFLMKFNSTATNGGVQHSTVSTEQPAPTIDTQDRLRVINPVFLSKYHAGDNPAKLNRNYSVDEPINTIDTQNRFYTINPLFLMKYFSGNPASKCITLDGPSGTIRTADGTAIVQAEFIMNPIGESKGTDSNAPLGTITASRRHWHYLISYHHSDKTVSVDQPMPTVTCKDKKAFISAEYPEYMKPLKGESSNDYWERMNRTDANILQDKKAFISAYYGNGHNCHSVDGAAPTVTSGDRFVLVSPHFLMTQMGASKTGSVENPAATVQTIPKQNLITAEQFLMDTQFGNEAKSLEEPSPTQTSNRKHYYLMNPQWFNSAASSIDKPCFTIIARQDKTPAYIICAETGCCAIEILETDMPHAILIKAFMVMYGLADVKMRMLEIVELLRIQGFGADYILKGSKTKQKWMLGNAVECNQAQVNIEASYAANKHVYDKALAA